MRNAAFGILAAATVVTSGLVPTAALAGTVKPRVLAYSSTAAGGGDPDTTVTFAVTTGALSMSASVSVNLGSGAPGTTISGCSLYLTNLFFTGGRSSPVRGRSR